MATTPDRAGRQWTDIQSVAALGEPLLELQPAERGEIRLAFGGDVANSMVCLARILGEAGPRISLITALGNSGYSEWLRAHLAREGIRLAEAPTEGEPGIYGLPVDAAHGSGFSYWRGRSAARQFLRSTGLSQLERLLGSPQLLLVTGITLALCSPSSFEHLCRWVERHREGCRVVFDCNFRRRLWESEEEARERVGMFESLASVIATGAEDEKTLWGAAGTPEIVERLSHLSAEYLIRGGPEGCWVGAGRDYQHVPTEPMTVIGDTAGAGDAHLASYMAARISGLDRGDAAAYANQVAAVIVGQRGSIPKETARFPALRARTSA
ncbi:MAG TPA: PfkB family carbohydrate kinase [Steroidobacteraceae bacterium]|nr:PfkB family carbohydrate kinase [Steroidobacteraceae bacterium]